MKTTAVLVFGMMFFLCDRSNSAENPHNRPNAKSASDISIKLTPESSTYNSNMEVHFYATIENKSSEAITIAHPLTCFPADFRQGNRISFKDKHGKSEIVLKVTKPNGIVVFLREGMGAFFENFENNNANNINYLSIPADNSEKFYVGWFFENARGRWENDDKAWKVFSDKGKYKVMIIFRNTFPRAIINMNNRINSNNFIDAWTGEMQSDEVTVNIK